MNFSKLKLRQFRNLREQTLYFKSGLNILYGSNGQGKTNLIEAIYFLTHGRSFRTNDVQVLVNRNDFKGFYLESEVINKNIINCIRMTVFGKVKSFILNEKKTTISKIRKTFFSILFSPESLQIIKSSDGKRRELIDGLCLSLFPGFSDLYKDCQKLLKHKNSLLKKIRNKEITPHEAEELNQHLSFQFFRKGSELCLLRQKAIERINALLSREFFQIMNDCQGKLFIEYLISDKVFELSQKDNIFNAMYKKWESLRKQEIALGQCLVGPHRHCIRFNFNGKNARFFCSQGQQRAIILAFKIAQTELHYKIHNELPVFLLDDVLSELDGRKQMNFLDKLLSMKGQIFLTTTIEDSLCKKKRSYLFNVKEGSFCKREILYGRRESSA